MAALLKGLPVSKALCEDLVARVEALKERGVTPSLEIVRVGEREDDLAYERGAIKRCSSVGIDVRVTVLDASCDQSELMDTVARINEDDSVHGCLMFRPLPAHLDERAACAALLPSKDVDCSTSESMFGVFAGRRVGFPPCTAEACMALLDHYGVDVDGMDATVVGRSMVIGRPLSMMLLERNATVTTCHTHTKDIEQKTRAGELLVVAAGHMGTLGGEGVRPGQIVLDVGINWDEEAGKLCGDVTFGEVEPVVKAITPVPGGVGSVTTAILAKHVVEAAERTVC
jgi:methylenetetrahydrofolate dehydrogenase (NADP+)/methenyltetrahydrofolate cyclohydrolase